MKDRSPHIDGFVVRRRNQPQPHQRRMGINDMKVPSRYLVDSSDPKLPSPLTTAIPKTESNHANTQRTIGSAAVTQGSKTPNQAAIDLTLPEEKGKKKRGRGRNRKPWTKKRIIKTVVIALVVILLVVGGYFAWRLFANAGRIFNGNLFNAVFSNKELKTDQYGRTNILLFGTSEDDPGHAGADLTDSIMIVSVDQKKKDAFLVSVPRDLWVKYGQACNSGYEGKINEMFLCGKGQADDEAAGANALRGKVGEVFGIDLQYSVHINYRVVRESVDAVGGVDITIESEDPRGILDRNFDWRCKYQCFKVKWPNGPAHLDGEQALFLAQARNDPGMYPGYGLPRGNFDREVNQRKIIIALKDKGTSAGFLSNPLAVTGLLDSLGNNVRTNIDAEEIKSFVALAKDTDTQKIASLSLVEEGNMLVSTGASPGGASIVRPVKGLYAFEDIQAFVKLHLSGAAEVLKEKAKVDVLNGSGTAGMAQKRAELLKAEGVTVENISNAPAGEYGTFKLYDRSNGSKPATKAKLEQNLGVSASTDALPAGITSTADFVIIVGADGVN